MTERENEIEITHGPNGTNGRIRVTGVVLVAIIAILAMMAVTIANMSLDNSDTGHTPAINVQQSLESNE